MLDWLFVGRLFVPRGTVMPVVTCMIPWPQSKDTSAGPLDWNGTERAAIVRFDSIQPIERNSDCGIRFCPATRFARAPTSIAGRPNVGSFGKSASTAAASIAAKYAARDASASYASGVRKKAQACAGARRDGAIEDAAYTRRASSAPKHTTRNGPMPLCIDPPEHDDLAASGHRPARAVRRN